MSAWLQPWFHSWRVFSTGHSQGSQAALHGNLEPRKTRKARTVKHGLWLAHQPQPQILREWFSLEDSAPTPFLTLAVLCLTSTMLPLQPCSALPPMPPSPQSQCAPHSGSPFHVALTHPQQLQNYKVESRSVHVCSFVCVCEGGVAVLTS